MSTVEAITENTTLQPRVSTRGGLDVKIHIAPLSQRALLPVWVCDCLVGGLGLAALLALSALAHWL
jgi:hypothetical protein